MKQHSLRMVVEVNKLIINTLIADGGVYLPSIGSLSVTTSTQADNSSVVRVISLSQGELHKSLVNVISERGNCTQKQAEHIYKKWIEVVVTEDVVTIDRVGVIQDGSFEITDELNSKLNPVVALPTPQKRVKRESDSKSRVKSKPKEKRRRSVPKWLYVAAAVIILAAIYLTIESVSKNRTVIVVDTPPIEQIETQKAVIEEATPTEPIKSTAAAEVDIDMSDTNSGVLNSYLKRCESATTRYKVVFGAYSSSFNAGKSLKEAYANGKNIDGLKLGAYERGGKYMVTLYESDDYNSCQDIINSNKFNDIATGLWIYEKK